MGDAGGVETPSPAVKLDGLVRRYGEREALSEVSLSLPAGATLVVFGPNGAGKTTLLRVLATLLRPHAGEVAVLGNTLPGEAWRVRGRVGLLAHEPLLYRELTARENLRYHARLHGVGDQRVWELLDALGLSDRADEPLRELSRGTVQRVAVARATLHDPELLLLDEPYANLDPAAIALVRPLIGAGAGVGIGVGAVGVGAGVGIGAGAGIGAGTGIDLARPGGDSARSGVDPPLTRPRTRVLCSHDPAGGLAEADMVLGLRAGRVALVAPAGEVDAAQIAELYR